MKHVINGLGIVLLLLSFSLKAGNVSEHFVNKAIIGTHDFTLQWLDNSRVGNRGKIEFSRLGDGIVAKGYQEERVDNELNFMKFSGNVVVISQRELRITGDLVTRIHHINGGEVLYRTGTFVFKAHGKRQYWRLQNHRKHEVIDYVDIHFIK
ncbi:MULTISPECIES: hypothetical protein [Vibrio]|uniref:Uncharacterized protein n=1 Tax=Vibrio ezurae NBRC 102218 TaxID=1219080 RepID=U3CBE3_9VIBR|nr:MULTISPECIES: hypothetical protein [Vibrio]MPW34871.1 hypothetical protein [Vibrio sp. B1Z05]GAD78644.1 hypothetical protein VEZ01S_05_00320 [Vibrio ezurae NBRC 102218]